MPIAPDTNRVFVPKPAESTHHDEIYSKFVSTIDKQLLDQSSDAMNALLKKTHALIGSGDRTKEQFTMRGHLDSLELVLNDMVTEFKYHTQ
jgi:hypothetical protein